MREEFLRPLLHSLPKQSGLRWLPEDQLIVLPQFWLHHHNLWQLRFLTHWVLYQWQVRVLGAFCHRWAAQLAIFWKQELDFCNKIGLLFLLIWCLPLFLLLWILQCRHPFPARVFKVCRTEWLAMLLIVLLCLHPLLWTNHSLLVPDFRLSQQSLLPRLWQASTSTWAIC